MYGIGDADAIINRNDKNARLTYRIGKLMQIARYKEGKFARVCRIPPPTFTEGPFSVR